MSRRNRLTAAQVDAEISTWTGDRLDLVGAAHRALSRLNRAIKALKDAGFTVKAEGGFIMPPIDPSAERVDMTGMYRGAYLMVNGVQLTPTIDDDEQVGGA